MPLRIAIDTGGTFTDCVWIDPTRRLRMLKVFSTPADPSQAIIEALRTIVKDVSSSGLVLLHGTTVGTNTLLERKGARVALVTTAGFEDVIEIGRQNRPKLYDFFFDRIQPLVPGDLRLGINERTAYDGEILTAPSPEELNSLRNRVAGKRPESIAISLLFSFANPKNELSIAQALQPLEIPLSISHQILPEFREYERTSTVVINAYLQPVMQNYLENLQSRAQSQPSVMPQSRKQGPRAEGRVPKTALRIFVMQSSGGITALSAAAREPVRTVLSGPAGGVVGARAMGRRSGFERIIAFDMGGTSTDVSLVEGSITTASDGHIAGLPVSVPMLNIHTVGAGGGSLARFDAAGVLRVGPESAGADPGPICYGRGVRPTVTDANLLLGRLQPHRFLGGDFVLDLDRTRQLTQEWLRQHSSALTLEQFAAGVIRVVNATMEKAIRVVSVERGRDPRDFALIAFGGAGGLHACALAEALSIPVVIIPALPGGLSAFGILMSDVVKDYSRTILLRVLDKLPAARLKEQFSALEKRATEDIRREGWHEKIVYQRSVDVRYRGQGYELNIPLAHTLLADFQQEHKRRYGYIYERREVELVTLRLRALVRPLKAATIKSGVDTVSRSVQHKIRKTVQAKVWFAEKEFKTGIYSRDDLRAGTKYFGPAVIPEYSATTVVPPGRRFGVDRSGNLIITQK